MTTIRAVLDDRRRTFITQPAAEGMLCDDCPQPQPATTEITDDPSGDSRGHYCGRHLATELAALAKLPSWWLPHDLTVTLRAGPLFYEGRCGCGFWSLRTGNWYDLGPAFGAHYLEAAA
jgi:hypothetical protein